MPTEATAFLGAVGMILVVLVVFYLYLNKKVCFTTVGGFPCCDVAPTSREKDKKAVARDLGELPLQANGTADSQQFPRKQNGCLKRTF